MLRRTIGLLVTLAVSLLVASLAADAQSVRKVYHVGLLSIGSGPTWRTQSAPFLEAMRELHYVEGQNLVIRPALPTR